MLPLKKGSGSPLAMTTRTTTTAGFWAQILEKAAAKAIGNYE
jgi:hypothetical protein